MLHQITIQLLLQLTLPPLLVHFKKPPLTIDCLLLSIHFTTANISTAAADDSSTTDCPLLAIHLAAASIPTAAADASITTARLMLTTHIDTTNITTVTAANTSNTTALMLIAIQFVTTTTDDQQTTTVHSFIDLPFAAAKFLATATIYATIPLIWLLSSIAWLLVL
jgi:hypothetical protein